RLFKVTRLDQSPNSWVLGEGLEIRDNHSGHPQSKGQNLHALKPNKFCAQVRSVDDMPFRTRASESSLAGGGNEKGLLAVDYMTGRAAAQKVSVTQKCLHAWPKVYRLDSVVHKIKRSSVQTQVGKRRITNQRVPGHITLPKDIESSHA
nr:hypothetical protein [Tanacetum cinerariifolium]